MSCQASTRGNAVAALPEGVRLTELRVRLPRHQVAMLEHFAERDRASVSSVLARRWTRWPAHVEELSCAVAGFAEALAWPDADGAQLPC